MTSATSLVKRAFTAGATAVRRHGRAGLVLGIAMAILALPGCSALGKWGSNPAQKPTSAGQSSTKKHKDPVNEFLATPRVPLDGVTR